MKRFGLFILILGVLLLSACAASDSSKSGPAAESGGVRGQESEDMAQTGTENILESADPAKTGPETPDASDRDENGKESRPSASHQESKESIPAKQQADGSTSGTHSQASAGPSGSGRDGHAQTAEEPKQDVPAEPAEAPGEPAAEPPAAAQPQEPEPAALEEPVQAPAEPEKPKSIYDYAFDVNAIRSELIAVGQSMGLTHITEDDGIPCTPDTCSWAAPVTASESFQGDNLKRALKDYVASMPSVIASYGGEQMTSFTIYVQDNGGGSYTFYFLY